nr:hypothetical protein [Paenibacillus humicus]
MAFGIRREELQSWKTAVARGELAFLTHYWIDERFPGVKTVTKAGCSDIVKLESWCRKHGLDPRYIHRRERYPHMDLFGPVQIRVLQAEGLQNHLTRFGIDT